MTISPPSTSHQPYLTYLNLGIQASQLASTEKTPETNSADDDVDMLDDQTDNVGAETTENSIVRIDRKQAHDHEALPEDDNDDEPDIYDINVLAWDVPVSALHLAIANGHREVVQLLVSDFGAELTPVKLLHDYNKSARAAILPLVLALHLPPGQVEEMTDALISLGASPSQADFANITALHYFAAHGAELLSQMCQADRPAAQRAVNHLATPKNHYGSSAKNALQSAIECRDPAGVKLLLELGAKPQVDFAAYLASRKINGDSLYNMVDYNKKQFRRGIQQPVFTAVSCDMPSVVSMLLDAGADVNELNQAAWSQIEDNYSYHNDSPQSLLDAVRERAESARVFLKDQTGEIKTFSLPHGKASAPILLEDEAHYLASYGPTSYAHWAVSKQLQNAKKNYEKDLSDWNKYEASGQVPEGVVAKAAAVEPLLAELELLEADILARGGKTFKELHPDQKLQVREQHDYSYKPTPPSPWEPTITFYLPDVTDERKAGYVRLFEACWHGDLTTIKCLTLAIWDENESPLQIAVRDANQLSPFSIAVMREHFDVARAILEIAHAQYAPEETTGKSKHSLVPVEEESEGFDTDEFQIYSEIVDDKFTIDEIGHVQNQVKSKITPLEMLSWPCPVSDFVESTFEDTNTPFYQHFTVYGSQGRRQRRKSTGGKAPRKVLKNAANNRFEEISYTPVHEYISEDRKPHNLFQLAIFLDDPELLHFLMSMGEDHTVHSVDTKADETAPKYFHFAEHDFLYAIRLGKVQLLQVIISRTGAGIPFNDLVKSSGIELPEKLEYYEGRQPTIYLYQFANDPERIDCQRKETQRLGQCWKRHPMRIEPRASPPSAPRSPIRKHGKRGLVPQ
jgi:ankyrin repeat protein